MCERKTLDEHVMSENGLSSNKTVLYVSWEGKRSLEEAGIVHVALGACARNLHSAFIARQPQAAVVIFKGTRGNLVFILL